MQILEETRVRTYRYESHLFSVEKSTVYSNPKMETFRVEILGSDYMLPPENVPESIVPQSVLKNILSNFDENSFV